MVRHIAEEGRVAIRNVRRDVHARPARAQGGGRRRAPTTSTAREAELQKLTDARIAELDALLKDKEEEILEV